MVTASQLAQRGAKVAQDGSRRTAYEWLRMSGVTLDMVAPDVVGIAPAGVLDEVIEDARYAPTSSGRPKRSSGCAVTSTRCYRPIWIMTRCLGCRTR